MTQSSRRPIDELAQEIDSMRERIDAQALHLDHLKRELIKIKEAKDEEEEGQLPEKRRGDKKTHACINVNYRNDFGREDASHLPIEYLSQCYLEKDIAGLMETLLFDGDHPENNTVRVVKESASITGIQTWRNGAWIAAEYGVEMDDEEVFTDIIRSAYRIMSRHARKHHESIVKMMGYDLDAFEDLKEFYEKLYDDDDRVQQSIKSDLAELVRTFSMPQ